MDKDLIGRAAEEAGKAALVTVIDVKGSAPRHPGSKMLVLAGGRIEGTVGGGKGESLAIEAGLAAIASAASSLLEVEMLGSDAEGKDLICGGVNRMLVEFIADASPYAAAARALESGQRVILKKRLSSLKEGGLAVSIEVLTEGGMGAAGAGAGSAAARAASSGKAAYLEAEGLFYDPLLPEERLLVVGGGHVGLALVRAALPLGFAVSVIDDRPGFLGADRFGPAVDCRLGPYGETIAAFPFDAATYAVILTRGHLMDLESCRAILRKTFRYAGLIGSSRKVGLIRGQLAEDGLSPETIARLKAPIGLSIGAETPEEIAISILSEIIACRHDVTAGSF
jgi:xanthine dehydrogenase accessory factor